MVFKKLVLFSMVSVNLGYTVFLFPLLGVLYPDRVPLTLYNLLAFILIDSIWGIILAIMIYLLVRLTGINLARAITFSITLLWITFWLISFLSTKDLGTIPPDYVAIVGIDSIAALITWFILSRLVKHYIAK